MIFCSLVIAVSSRTPRPGAAHPDHSAPGLGSCLSQMTPPVRLSPSYFTLDLRDAPHLPTPGLDLVLGQAPAHRLAREAFMLGEPHHLARQQLNGPAGAALRRGRAAVAPRPAVAPRRASSLPESLRSAPGRGSSLRALSRLPSTKRRLVR